jgi:hypothetical protein
VRVSNADDFFSSAAVELFVANRGSFRFGDFAPFVIGAKPPSAGATGSPDHTQHSQPFITVGELTHIVDSTCPELDTVRFFLLPVNDIYND